jgi:hypothetical protein
MDDMKFAEVTMNDLSIDQRLSWSMNISIGNINTRFAVCKSYDSMSTSLPRSLVNSTCG